MTDRPILFSAPMVQALLAGRKTQTRRVLKSAIGADFHRQTEDRHYFGFNEPRDDGRCGFQYPRLPFAIRDRLWVKETWRASAQDDGLKPRDIRPHPIGYVADEPPGNISRTGKTRVSIFMPRWASRLTLIVTDVRVQRLHDCSEADALDEGIYEHPCAGPFRGPGATYFAAAPEDGNARTTPVAAYAALWDSINGSGAWDANPWVVAVSFTVERCNIARLSTPIIERSEVRP